MTLDTDDEWSATHTHTQKMKKQKRNRNYKQSQNTNEPTLNTGDDTAMILIDTN